MARVRTRDPHEIVQDLLLYIRYLEKISDTTPASSEDEPGAVTVEAQVYLDNIAEDQAAWDRLFSHPFFRTAPLVDLIPHTPTYPDDGFRESRSARRANYDSGL